jgi:hypothetical protein
MYSSPLRGRLIVDTLCLRRLCYNETSLLSTQAIIGHFRRQLHLAWLYGSLFGRPMTYERAPSPLAECGVKAIKDESGLNGQKDPPMIGPVTDVSPHWRA